MLRVRVAGSNEVNGDGLEGRREGEEGREESTMRNMMPLARCCSCQPPRSPARWIRRAESTVLGQMRQLTNFWPSRRPGRLRRERRTKCAKASNTCPSWQRPVLFQVTRSHFHTLALDSVLLLRAHSYSALCSVSAF